MVRVLPSFPVLSSLQVSASSLRLHGTRNARIPCLFRTYKAPEFRSPNCTIWEAARATSATLTIFEPIVINEEPFVDGGMGRNNPTHQVFQEIELMFPDQHIACIISIGMEQAQTINIPELYW